MSIINFLYKIIPIMFQLSILVVKCTEFRSRTFAGDEVDIRRVPYTVSISMGCTGALIRKQWVISAAHCFVGKEGWKNLTVALGTSDRKVRDYEIRIAKVYINPYYGGRDTVAPPHDIALVKLTSPAILSESVQVLQLEKKPWPKKLNRNCTLAGYSQNMYQNRKLHMSTFYLSYGCGCIQKKNVICYQHLRDGGDTPCFGDSGSILVCDDKGAAVTSSSVGMNICGLTKNETQEYGCAIKNTYHFFTHIRPHLNWINNIMPQDRIHGYWQNKANIIRVYSIQYHDIITILQLVALLIIFSSYF